MGLGITEIIGDKREQILLLAEQYGANNMRIFGSVLRGEATETSDVDLLAHFPEADVTVLTPPRPYWGKIGDMLAVVRQMLGLYPIRGPHS